MTARAVLVEDELLLRQQLEAMLAVAWPELLIVDSVGDGAQALVALEAHRPDVLFLDVEMPEFSGLEVARRASGRCHVVFVTAFSQHAVEAFDAGAVDYVLKPLSEQRLARACARLRERFDARPVPLDGLLTQLAARVAQARPYLRWITAARGANVRMITTDEVCYFQSDSKYTRVLTVDSESLISMPLKDLLEQLDPAVFWQIHRSTIVNVQAIGSVGRDGDGRMFVRLEQRSETLRVSQPFAYRFRQM